MVKVKSLLFVKSH